MRTIRLLSTCLVLVLTIAITSCRSSKSNTGTVGLPDRRPSTTSTSSTTRTTTAGNLPPGQAKKLNGDQSAKAYAPGQQKKNGAKPAKAKKKKAAKGKS